MTKFTRNWTGRVKWNWNKHLLPWTGPRPIAYLELGVFEAKSALWILDNVLTEPDDRYIGIDPWELAPMGPNRFPRDGRGQELIEAVETRARQYLASYGDKATLIKGRSAAVLTNHNYDAVLSEITAVYIDGAHSIAAVLTDFGLIWNRLEVGGVVIWDDYCKDAKYAIDGCLEAVAKHSEVLFKSNQVGIRKTAAAKGVEGAMHW